MPDGVTSTGQGTVSISYPSCHSPKGMKKKADIKKEDLSSSSKPKKRSYHPKNFPFPKMKVK